MLRFLSALFLLFSLLLLSGCKYAPYLKYFTARKGHYPRFHSYDRLTGGINRFRACYDVTFYALDVRPDMNKKRLSGTMRIHCKALLPFDTLLLDLHPSFRITRLTVGEVPVKYYRKRGALFVVVNRQQQPGETNTISISYEGKPITLSDFCPVVWEVDRYGAPWVSTICEGVGAHLLWPCKSLLYDEADSSSVRITVPKGLMAVSNGVLRETTETATENTFAWFASNPINVYNLSFAIGSYKKLTTTYENASGKHELQFFVLAHQAEVAAKHLAQVSEIIGFLEGLYGEYPWYNDGYKLIHTPGNTSMEHQTAIHFSGSFANPELGYDNLILHETAHEWWGNSMTAADYGDLWLHEAFATYSELLYIEHKSGRAMYESNMSYLFLDPKQSLVHNTVPMAKPYGVRYSPLIADRDDDIYLKGAALLHSLRWAMQDDSLFFRVLKTFYGAHQKSIITTAQFIAHVNTLSGRDYTWLFEQYLFDHRVPELNYTIKPILGKPTLFYSWKNTVVGFEKMPIRVSCGTESRFIYPSPVEQSTSFASADSISFYTPACYYTVKRVK